MKILNIVIFGFGRAGKIHYKNLMLNNNFNLTHIVEIYDISSKIDKMVKYVNYNDNNKVDEIFNDNKIHCIIIASPTKTHYELIMKALKNNKNVFVEKPIVEEYIQIKKCFELSKLKNLKLFVGYNRRFDPIISKIKQRVQNNEIGFVNYAITISRDFPYPSDNFLSISGGVFHDCATHDIDYMNWILNDKPNYVYVNVEDNKTKKYNFDHISINFKYSKGTIVSMNLSRLSTSYDQRCEFYGSKGEIINNSFTPNCKLSFPDRYDSAFKNELQEFYNCIVNNTEPSVTEQDCLNNLIIANACQDACDKQEKIIIKY